MRCSSNNECESKREKQQIQEETKQNKNMEKIQRESVLLRGQVRVSEGILDSIQ